MMEILVWCVPLLSPAAEGRAAQTPWPTFEADLKFNTLASQGNAFQCRYPAQLCELLLLGLSDSEDKTDDPRSRRVLRSGLQLSSRTQRMRPSSP